jgi:hypothetical protein
MTSRVGCAALLPAIYYECHTRLRVETTHDAATEDTHTHTHTQTPLWSKHTPMTTRSNFVIESKPVVIVVSWRPIDLPRWHTTLLYIQTYRSDCRYPGDPIVLHHELTKYDDVVHRRFGQLNNRTSASSPVDRQVVHSTWVVVDWKRFRCMCDVTTTTHVSD